VLKLPKEVEDFWAARWGQNLEFDYEYVNQLFPIQTVFNEELNKSVFM
jgi:hypothetical protein